MNGNYGIFIVNVIDWAKRRRNLGLRCVVKQAERKTSKVIDSIELFCGTGGLALGFHQAGFKPKALIERDKISCDTIKANITNCFVGMEPWNVVQTDVRQVQYSDFGGGVQFITGGPPCQPFSLGGKHKANEDTRDMFPEAVRAVRELRPLGFAFENVKGLLRKSFSSYFNYVLLQLSHPEIEAKADMDWTEHLQLLEKHQTSSLRSGLGYNVVFRLVNAADYGVPQVRYRVIIVGFRNDIDASWTFPEPTHSKEELLKSKYSDGTYWEEHKIPMKSRPEVAFSQSLLQLEMPSTRKKRWQTVRDAIAGLPEPQAGFSTSHLNHEYREGARSYPGHTGSFLDEPSKTIKAGVHGVPGGENTINLDNGQLRYYTVRESARIQTFPDEYRFHGSWTTIMRQIGNAVPVKLASVIGASIARQLERINVPNA